MRAKTVVGRQGPAKHPAQLQRQLGEGPGLVKPVVVAASAAAMPRAMLATRGSAASTCGRACRERTRTRRSTTLSQSGTAVPARK